MLVRLLPIYDRFPRSVKRAVTMSFIWSRGRLERVARVFMKTFPPCPDRPRVVYLSGLPRSGTSVLKAYFGDYPGLHYFPFDPLGFFKSWNASGKIDDIIVDKSNHYIEIPRLILDSCGTQAALCAIVRDPRDNLASLINWWDSLYMPRSEEFWYGWWEPLYSRFIELGAEIAGKKVRLFLLRYEDLVRWPLEAKTAFLRWLGVPHSVPISNSYRARKNDRGVEPAARGRHSLNARSIGKWKTVTEPRCKQMLRTWSAHPKTVALMNRLGYSADGVVDLPIRLEGITTFQPRSE